METQPPGASTPSVLPEPLAGRRPTFAERIRSTPPKFFWAALGGMIAYLLALSLTGHNRPDQFVICTGLMVFVVWSDGTRRFFVGMLPFVLFGVVYDLTHITEPLFRYLHIHILEPYNFDRTFFGIRTPEGLLTPNEYFERHHWPWVDFLTGTSYIIFVYWAIGFAGYLALFRRDEWGQRLLRYFGWTFLILNVVGFATYYVYPAAPPWYVAQYGFGPPNFNATSSMAGAARWDELTGIPYFHGFYGRSADVFGAIPSLHVSYPLLTFLFGRRLKKLWFDIASLSLFFLVSFAAVYLDHHYVLDVLLGVVYTLVAFAIALLLDKRKAHEETAAARAS